MSKATKYVLFVGILIIALGALLLYARPDGQNSAGVSIRQEQGTLSADRAVHDFGTISMKNGNVKTVFNIKNTQAAAVSLNKMYTSCMCTEATLKIGGTSEGPFGMPGHGMIRTFDHILQPNEEAEIEVEFNPNAHGPAGVGRIERTVIVEGSGRELLTVAIKANVVP